MNEVAVEANRRAYLDALGVDVWVERDTVHEDVGESLADVAVEAPADWGDLRARVAKCERCALHKTRTQTVFGVGNTSADWMIIGEAPGAEEDRRGEPFVGRAGKLLDEMLRAVGLERDAVFIANILKCRPPNNRDPSGDEAAECRDHLERQIQMVAPKLLLAVGRIAAQQLLESSAPVGRMRGSVHHFARFDIPLVVTYHPAYLLRSPVQKRKVWQDLCLARAAMQGTA